MFMASRLRLPQAIINISGGKDYEVSEHNSTLNLDPTLAAQGEDLVC
jgi:hypothetical protein